MEFNPFNPDRFEAFCWKHLSKELKHPIEDFHRELIHLIRYQRIAIAAPRGFAKSSYFSYFYPLFAALEQPGVKILCVSATGTFAETWLYRIRTLIETSTSIRSFYGEQKGAKWTTEEIQFQNGSSIMAKGAGKQIRGLRPDIIIGDDLETEEIVASTEQRRKFDHWFWTDLMGTLLPHSQVIVVGTLLDNDSFLAELIKHGRHGWETRFYQALKPGNVSLWETQWPTATLLARKKEMGDYAFAQEYMNDPIPQEFRTFQECWFKYYDKLPDNLVYFTTIDPAIEIGSTNDFTAIVTCGIDIEENIFVVDVINKRLLPDETIDAIFNVYKRWKPASMGIEVVGFQKMLKYDLDREKKRRKQYPVIVELKSEGRRKSLRIEALQPFFQAGKIWLRKDQEDLRTQLLRFPSTRCNDDIIDALAYQLNIIRPAKDIIAKVNPNCFLAQIEKDRRSKPSANSWGNHKLRGVSL